MKHPDSLPGAAPQMSQSPPAFCLEMLYSNLPFISRLTTARADGVEAIEMWDWRDKNLGNLERALHETGLRLANMSGNRKFGMLESEHHDAFVEEIRQAGQVAKRLECPRLMLLAQPLLPDNRGKPLSRAISTREKIANAVRAGRSAARVATELDLEIVIEPLNSVNDHPGFFMNASWMAFRVITEIGHPRVRLLYDVYHMAMMDEDLEHDLTRNLDKIGHIHIADKPGRHEPGTGVLPLNSILCLLQALNYNGGLGFEFDPSTTDAGTAVKRALQVVESSTAKLWRVESQTGTSEDGS